MKYPFEEIEVGVGDYVYRVTGTYVSVNPDDEGSLVVQSVDKYDDDAEDWVALDAETAATFAEAYADSIEEEVFLYFEGQAEKRDEALAEGRRW